MEKLIAELSAELRRLYLAPEAATQEALAQHILGHTTLAFQLTTADGLTRALAIPFRRSGAGGPAQHWNRLCEVANALQAELGLPAPAVSIDGANAFYLWLSLEEPVAPEQAQDFLKALRQAYYPESELAPDAATVPVFLPPCLNPRTGKWAAFIHPGMGASFADESGLEMAPPLAGQVAFLEALESVSASQFQHALRQLEQAQAGARATTVGEARSAPASQGATPVAQPAAATSPVADDLLLKDATLEDIVRVLHARGIEPTFRFLVP